MRNRQLTNRFSVEAWNGLGFVADGVGALDPGKVEAIKPFLTDRVRDGLTGKNDAPPVWAYPLGMAYLWASGYKVHTTTSQATPAFTAAEVAEMARFAKDNGLKVGANVSPEATVMMYAARQAFAEISNEAIAKTAIEQGHEADQPTFVTSSGGPPPAPPGSSAGSSAGSAYMAFVTSPTGIAVGVGAIALLGGAWWWMRRAKRAPRSPRRFSAATTSIPAARTLSGLKYRGFRAVVPKSRKSRRARR